MKTKILFLAILFLAGLIILAVLFAGGTQPIPSTLQPPSEYQCLQCYNYCGDGILINGKIDCRIHVYAGYFSPRDSSIDAVTMRDKINKNEVPSFEEVKTKLEAMIKKYLNRDIVLKPNKGNAALYEAVDSNANILIGIPENPSKISSYTILLINQDYVGVYSWNETYSAYKGEKFQLYHGYLTPPSILEIAKHCYGRYNFSLRLAGDFIGFDEYRIIDDLKEICPDPIIEAS